MIMIGRYSYGLTSILLALCLGVSVRAGDKDQMLDQKKELEKIRKDVETGQRRLDSLKDLQMSIQQQIADADQKISSDKKVIGRLNYQLKQLKNDIADADQELIDRKDRLEWSQRRSLGNLFADRMKYLLEWWAGSASLEQLQGAQQGNAGSQKVRQLRIKRGHVTFPDSTREPV